MLILHIIIDLTAGGAELMLKRLALAHKDQTDLQHRVLSLRSIGPVGLQLQAAGIEVEALDMWRIWHVPRAIWAIAARIRSLKPDIVQTWMYHSDLIGGLVARMVGYRDIIWGVRIAEIGQEVGVSPMTSWIRRGCAALSYRLPKRIVYVAQSARKVHEDLGYDPSKSIVIPNGYSLPSIPIVERSAAPLRRELGLPSGALLVGSAGRYNRQKDHRGFVRACSLLADRRSDVQFVMIGRQVDRENEELMGWIREGGCEDRFHLLGERHDMGDCLSALDIFCLHSLTEGFPNVVAEAMSARIPCVVTDVGDAALIVGDSGAVVPAGDPHALADALNEMVEQGPAARAALGERARERVATHYSIERIAARYEELYADVLAASVTHS